MKPNLFFLFVVMVTISILQNTAESVSLSRQPRDLDAATRSKLHQLKEKALAGGNKCNKRLIGYVTHWSPRPFTIKQSLSLTHAIYAFVELHEGGRLSLPSFTTSKDRLNDVIRAKKAHRDHGLNFKVLFAIGGGGENSRHFSSVMANAGSRGFLINEITRVMKEHNFDGVDIDWEFPGAANGDKSNYVTFLRELRARLGQNRLISLAAASGSWELAGFDIANLAKYVNWIGVMSYDFFGEWSASVGPNAGLRSAGRSDPSGKRNVDWAIKQYVCNSKDKGKIVMGVPFYGWFWSETAPTDGKNPLHRTAQRLSNGSYGGAVSYKDLLNDWHLSTNPRLTKYWHGPSSTPLATDGRMVLSYDNERSMTEKVKYASEHNLGGVMIWSVDQDAWDLTLLDTVFRYGCSGASSGGSVNYKCNPLGTEKRWWSWDEDKEKAGMCGRKAPLYRGYYPVCNPEDPGYHCCNKQGWCGSGADFCDCEGCVDYVRHPEKLVEEPVRPR